MIFFKRAQPFTLFTLICFASTLWAPLALSEPEAFKKHSIQVTYEDPPHPIGPSPFLEQKLDSPPTDSELEAALSDPADPLSSLAQLYLSLNQALGSDAAPLCLDVAVRNGDAQFVISLPTDEAFEIGSAHWTLTGFKNWKALKKALILTSQNLKSLYHSNAPVDWTIDGYADALPYLDAGSREIFYNIRKNFELSQSEILQDLEKQKTLARSRAESYLIPIQNPEEDLQDWVKILEIRGYATDQVELNSALWSAQNRALPAHKTFFNEPSLLACKTRRKIKFSTTGALGHFPLIKRTNLFETKSPPKTRTLRVADVPVIPHFMDQSIVREIKTEVMREIHRSIQLIKLGDSLRRKDDSADEPFDLQSLSEKVLKNLSDRGVFISCSSQDYLCTLALKFIQSQIEGKSDESTFGDHLISLIHSGLASIPALALDIPKEIDHKTIESVGDLIALYRVPDDRWRSWGETRIRGETLLLYNLDSNSTDAIRLVLPDGSYTCTRCGSGSVVSKGNLTPKSRIIERSEVFKESITRASRIDSNVLGASLSPTSYFVTQCNLDCSHCGGTPIETLISRSSVQSTHESGAHVYTLNPILSSDAPTPLIPIHEFRTGCLVTRKVLESCNVESDETLSAFTQTWSTHTEEVEDTSNSLTLIQNRARIESPDLLELRTAIKRLKCSSSPETSIPTWDQYGDCHLDAWRPEAGPGSWEWFQKKSNQSERD